MKIQITLFCTTGQYRPISTLIEVESVEDFKTNLKKYKKQALQKMCAQRYRDGASLLKSGYTQMKWRIYDEEERRKYDVQQIMNQMNKNK